MAKIREPGRTFFLLPIHILDVVSMASQIEGGGELRKSPPIPPLTPPAMALAEILRADSPVSARSSWRSSVRVAGGGVRRGYFQKRGEGGERMGGCLPQNVEPRVNHWRPDAMANRVGVVERRTPLTAPKRRPDTPGVGVSWGVWILFVEGWWRHVTRCGGSRQAEERPCLGMNQLKGW